MEEGELDLGEVSCKRVLRTGWRLGLSTTHVSSFIKFVHIIIRTRLNVLLIPPSISPQALPPPERVRVHRRI
jgi:hypothetical protein